MTTTTTVTMSPEDIAKWDSLAQKDGWYELEVEWKTDEPSTVVKFPARDEPYSFPYDAYSLCVAAAIDHLDKTPGKVITLSKVWIENDEEIFEVLETTTIK